MQQNLAQNFAKKYVMHKLPHKFAQKFTKIKAKTISNSLLTTYDAANFQTNGPTHKE